MGMRVGNADERLGMGMGMGVGMKYVKGGGSRGENGGMGVEMKVRDRMTGVG